MVKALSLVKEVYDTFNMPFVAKLSTMPEKHMGDEELWAKATATLKRSLESNKIPYTINEGDGAFYGPKIDFDVTDSMGRKWQCATIQVDYQLPLRFKLEYTGEDGKEHTPVIIHRAILGSLERFIGVLIEHYKGRFPTWLAPVQVQVVSISDQTQNYAEEIYDKIKAEKVRVHLDSSDRTLQYKIREAQMQQIPYVVVLGKKEQEGGVVTIRDRTGKQTMGIKLEDFMKSLRSEISERRELGLK
jgi:threonyl-tRNA synthetase